MRGAIGFAIPNQIGTPASPGRAEQRNGRLSPPWADRFVWVPGRAEHVQAQAKTRCANLPRFRHSSPGTIARPPRRKRPLAEADRAPGTGRSSIPTG